MAFFPSIKNALFGRAPELDEMSARLRTRRLQAQVALVVGLVMPAGIVVAGMFSDSLNARAIALFASVSALTGASTGLLAWYWGSGVIENKSIIKNAPPPADDTQ